jgi:selenocysteine lyase/cysteine desulfurase
VLATDHEYGAMDRTWRCLARRAGFSYVRHAVPLPVTTSADLVEGLWAGVTQRTRVIFFSHISSATALIFPVAEICRRARAAGLLTMVDGAHAPGQVPLDLQALGADIYLGACHKWYEPHKPKLCDSHGKDSAFRHHIRRSSRWRLIRNSKGNSPHGEFRQICLCSCRTQSA